MVRPILTINNLSAAYNSPRGKIKAVRDVNLEVREGETLAIIGESGCGKTTLALSLVRLLPKVAQVTSGEILYHGRGTPVDVLKFSQGDLRKYRWADCAMVFQSALNALNPVLRIRAQVLDTARAHGEHNERKTEQRILRVFESVRLDPDRVYNAYPHELSGGMRQRVLLAIGLLLNPKIVILDEPTTALDVLTQRTIIEVLKHIRQEMGFALLFISHDLSLAAELAHRVVTMYAGQLVEVGPVNDVFYEPMQPYTLGLMRAAPGLHSAHDQVASIPGAPPDLVDPPPGCKFYPRCTFRTDLCLQQEPPLQAHGDDHQSACHHWEASVKAAQDIVKAIKRT